MDLRASRGLGRLLSITLALAGCGPAEGGAGDPVAQLNEGVALLEQYDYGAAYKIFERLARAHPQWEAAHVNKGLAALNLQKNDYLQVAEKAFTRALELNPRCIHALVSRGLLYQHQNRVPEMARDFQAAARLDPEDPYVLFYVALVDLEAGRLAEARAGLEKVVKLQPSFSSAFWRLRELYVKLQDRAKMEEAVKEFTRLKASDTEILVGLKYGEGGKYNLAIRDSVPPGWKTPAPPWSPSPPAFGPRVKISTGPGVERLRPDGKPQAPGFAAGDLNGDGTLELVLCGERLEGAPEGAVTIYGLDASGAWKLGQKLDLPAHACALGDLDGDFDNDLLLAAEGALRFFENDGKGMLAPKELKVEGAAFAGFPVRLYVADADSDWDLDVVCLRQEKGAGGKVTSRLEVLNNNGDGTFKDIAPLAGLGPFDFPAVELIVGDLDDDVDADILVFDGLTGAAVAYANDRVWRYHRVEGDGASAPRAPGILTTAGGDFDGDGDLDLVLFCGATLRFWRNVPGLRFQDDEAFASRFGSIGGTGGVLADIQGALRTGLLVLGPKSSFIPTPEATEALPVSLEGMPVEAPGGLGALLTVVGPQRAPELIAYGGGMEAAAYSLGSPASWLVLDLVGPRKPTPKLERSNAAGIGGSVEVRAGLRRARFFVQTGAGGTARQPPRVHCGLGGESSADYVRIIWPDSVLQAERKLAKGKLHRIQELERKPTSCPILFAQTASGFEFVADFLGVGGLGYFEAPGIYSKPDPSEYVLLPDLAVSEGRFVLDILEPLEECTYLDELKLTVVEHPAQVTVIPDEMFAVRGPQPGFRLLAFRETLVPGLATDDAGSDVTEALLSVDRRYGNRFRRDPRFPGLAADDHSITLDFGDGIRSLAARAGARAVLFLHGYVEYGYSTSNFAAWQAKASFRAPSVRVERNGRWIALREEWGFPAGYPRYMAVDLSGLLEPDDRRLRVDTNMDIHWDQAFLADASAEGCLEVTELAAESAELRFAGYPREESPDGAEPDLYVYRDFEPTAPFKDFPGSYTRYGESRDLLGEADDRFVVLGPGDGLKVRFHAGALPPLPPGRRRTFLARTFGYCKDMDLYTAHPDRVEPLPFRAMSGYPFRPGESRPPMPADQAYQREWNTRIVR